MSFSSRWPNDALRIWHPFTPQSPGTEPLHVVKAEGVYLHLADGRRIIDGISSWWVNLHGHNHPAIMSAIARQTEKLDHVLLAGFTHEPIEELCAKLRNYLPSSLKHIFFSDDGSTAVEVSLKLAAQYWSNLGKNRKRRFIALEHAYHGDTVGAMSVGDDGVFGGPFEKMCFPAERVHSAYCFRCPVGKRRETCEIDCVEDLARRLEARHEEIAAVIVEPLLQGAGGMIIHPVEFLQRVRGLCSRYNVLLIADEVLTGFGRCGKMFACELAGIAPDLMCFSKGITGGVLPMGATICTEAIHGAFSGSDPEKTFYHGHSYTGNPIAAAAAVASLEIFEREPVFERISRIEEIHKRRLAQIASHPAAGEVRLIGTVAVIELKADDPGYSSRLGPKLYDFFLRSGVLLRPLGNVVYVLPPYVITPAELNFIHDRIAEALDHSSEWNARAPEKRASGAL